MTSEASRRVCFSCVECGGPIREGEQYQQSVGTPPFCVKCALTYRDLQDAPQGWVGDKRQELPPETIFQHVQAHISKGGSLDDGVFLLTAGEVFTSIADLPRTPARSLPDLE
ncbi:hypothetical protein ACMG4P_11345 [Pseudovibrio denitrificans]|uniref:hypothetical protein n=1 Tax=Pseudovibrio denitrificans TaxID=258256 RepID=UPI0039BF4A85